MWVYKHPVHIISAPNNKDEQLSVYLAQLAELSIVYYYDSNKRAM